MMRKSLLLVTMLAAALPLMAPRPAAADLWGSIVGTVKSGEKTLEGAVGLEPIQCTFTVWNCRAGLLTGNPLGLSIFNGYDTARVIEYESKNIDPRDSQTHSCTDTTCSMKVYYPFSSDYTNVPAFCTTYVYLYTSKEGGENSDTHLTSNVNADLDNEYDTCIDLCTSGELIKDGCDLL